MEPYEMFINNTRTAESWDSPGPINTIRCTVSQIYSFYITATTEAYLLLVTKKLIIFFSRMYSFVIPLLSIGEVRVRA
jgi:hypothetical protein